MGASPSVFEFHFAGKPPCTFLPTQVCLSLASSPKATGIPVELRGQAVEHAESIPIYTDGSKSTSGVGCAAVFPDFETFVSLPLMALIFTDELCAIFLAFTRIPAVSFRPSRSYTPGTPWS